MLIGAPRERREGKLRTPCTPTTAKKLVALGLDVVVETGTGDAAGFPDAEYAAAGYVAVIRASFPSSKIFPMIMTPAGTIAPARVFVIGAGVAGLQAIATTRTRAKSCAIIAALDATFGLVAVGAAVTQCFARRGATKNG